MKAEPPLQTERDFLSNQIRAGEDEAPASPFTCRKCGSGNMQPAIDRNELELTDTYVCSHCGHKAIIPSHLIIFSQLLCGLVGGLVAGYLFIQEMSALMTALQFSLERDMAGNTVLMLLSLAFLAGFGFTIYHGFLGLTIRRLYIQRNGISSLNTQTPAEKQ